MQSYDPSLMSLYEADLFILNKMLEIVNCYFGKVEQKGVEGIIHGLL